jgi:polyferredoxin
MGYIVMLCVMVSVFSYNVATRIPLEMTVMRDRNNLYVETGDGGVENIYRLQYRQHGHAAAPVQPQHRRASRR